MQVVSEEIDPTYVDLTFDQLDNSINFHLDQASINITGDFSFKYLLIRIKGTFVAAVKPDGLTLDFDVVLGE